mgnify:CR=1 FL=1
MTQPLSQLVSLGLYNPKSATNVAAILRAIGCYGGHSVFYTGQRFRHAKEFHADTKSIHRNLPTLGVDDLREVKPQGAVSVAIELVEGAQPLPEFQHPENAYYIFGPEDGSMPKELVQWCDHVVYIPTHGSMNLAATANVVLYDRMSKGDYAQGDKLIRQARDRNNNL